MAPIRCRFDQTAVWHSDAARGPSTPSLDHLVGAGKKRRRNFEAKCPRGVEVDHQFKLARLHHWQVGRLGALKDARGIESDLAPGISKAGSIAHQPADFHEKTLRIGCRKRVACRQNGKLGTPRGEESASRDK